MDEPTQEQQQQQQQQQQQLPANPEYDRLLGTLPENMRGKDAYETLSKIAPAFQGYHKAAHERGPSLNKDDNFQLEITHEKAKPFFDQKSPMSQAFSKAAVEADLTKTQASKLGNSVMGLLADGGHLAQQFDPVKNLTEIAAVLGFKQIDDAAKTGLQQFETESLAWAKNTAKQLKLDDVGRTELESLTLTPGGVQIIKALRAMSGQGGLALGGAGAGDGQFFSREELKKMDADPHIDPRKSTYDKTVREKYDASYMHHFSKRA